MPDLAHRELIPERMDDPSVDVHELGPALRFLEVVNVLPGGAGLVTKLVLADRARWRPGEALTLVDVGTGSADVPRALVSALRQLGHPAHALGVDLRRGPLAFSRGSSAQAPGVALVNADALALPMRDGAVDYAVSSNFLHHLDDREAVRCLAEMRRVARRGIILTDLVRTRLAYAAVRAMTWLAGNEISAHDGPVSVRRAFIPEELLERARVAGITGARVSRHAPFRVALTANW